MWPFKKRKRSIHFDLKKLGELEEVLTSYGLIKTSTQQSIVGVVDLTILRFTNDTEWAELSIDHYSGIDVIGSEAILDRVGARLLQD